MRALVVLLVAVLGLAPGLSVACACADPEVSAEDLVAELFAAADVVAVMEVVDVARLAPVFEGVEQAGRWYVLEPRHTFKGSLVPGAHFHARAPRRFVRSDCEVSLRRGELVLVYAKAFEPVDLRFCSPSGRLLSRFGELPILFRISAGRS